MASGIYTGNGSATATAESVIFVGSRPLGNGRWGHADLAGNVQEWNLDAYSAIFPSNCVDCAVFSSPESTGQARSAAVQGGAFNSDASLLTVTATTTYAAVHTGTPIGIRCARD